MIGYRNADGSTVLPDGSVIKADGSRLPPGTSKYPPDPEIGGLHPITLPDPPVATGLPFTVQPSAPSSSGSFSGPTISQVDYTFKQMPGESEDAFVQRLSAQAQAANAATWKRWFFGASIVAVGAAATAAYYARKKGGL